MADDSGMVCAANAAGQANERASKPRIRPAHPDDMPALHKIINKFAESGEMLPRTLSELYENVRDYIVADVDGRIAGGVALHIYWRDLAEIKALAVDAQSQGLGLGRMLVTAAMDEARRLSIPRVFALTFKPGFFVKLGYTPIDKHDLPQKIWTECVRCPKFPDCNEQAVVIDLH
ncbi:MAG: Amino-acid acetyltransferase [candidate division BRC1 bacterium ADurb.BinA364]|nr:MAG: Amino-acid acetyltransferase [candidate division BRC1 bacterium ADurb.BinA364]